MNARSRLSGRLSALAVAVTVALVVLPPAASADNKVSRDGAGDTWSPEGFDGWEATGSPRNVDLVRTSLNHRAARVVLTARYTDLVQRDDEIDLTFSLRTNAGRAWRLFVRASYNDPATFRLGERAPDRTECDGVTGSLSYARDTVRVVVPRRCLGNPQWITYAALAEMYNEGDGLFIDDALSPSPEPRTWSSRVHVG
jgi:hypothetical protein